MKKRIASINRGLRQLAEGKSTSHREAVASFKRTLAKLKKRKPSA